MMSDFVVSQVQLLNGSHPKNGKRHYRPKFLSRTDVLPLLCRMLREASLVKIRSKELLSPIPCHMLRWENFPFHQYPIQHQTPPAKDRGTKYSQALKCCGKTPGTDTQINNTYIFFLIHKSTMFQATKHFLPVAQKRNPQGL